MSRFRAYLANGLVIDCPLHSTAFDGKMERAVTRSCDGNALVETAADGWSRRIEFSRGDGRSTLQIKLSKSGETFCGADFCITEIAPAERTPLQETRVKRWRPKLGRP